MKGMEEEEEKEEEDGKARKPGWLLNNEGKEQTICNNRLHYNVDRRLMILDSY